jgi:membrane dipeptidase
VIGSADVTSGAHDLHARANLVDCHLDLMMTVVLERQIGARATFADRWLPELKEAGVKVQVVPVYTEFTLPAAHLHEALRQIAAFKRQVELNPERVAHCRTGSAVRSALDSDRLAMILALEGASALQGDASLVSLFFELGVRMISLTHEWRTQLADGSGENAAGSRLSTAGVQVLAEMERLGILMDVSHLGRSGVAHVLELASRPLIASHSGSDSVHPHHRNLTDEEIRGIAATGGVVCIIMLPHFVAAGEATPEHVVNHIEHMASVAGFEHVGLGSDFIADIVDDCFPTHMRLGSSDLRKSIVGLRASRDLVRVTEAMLRRGFSDEQVLAILGDNLMRVFDEVIGCGPHGPV